MTHFLTKLALAMALGAGAVGAYVGIQIALDNAELEGFKAGMEAGARNERYMNDLQRAAWDAALQENAGKIPD